MSVDLIYGESPPPAFDVDRPIEAVRVGDASSQVVGGKPPRVVAGGSTGTVEALLLSVARGDQEAFVALQSRMAGLVRVNVRRVLRDGARSEAVTQRTLAEVLEDAIHFDPHRGSAQTWLLKRAHQRAMDELRSVDGTDKALTAISGQSASASLP
jgi:RNA polymerase sigma-70 factor, ECF subfamily